MHGAAPDAQVLVMKVFGDEGGAYDSDYTAAIEDAIVLGADTINLSLGSTSPARARRERKLIRRSSTIWRTLPPL